jgi:hypothetical protein
MQWKDHFSLASIDAAIDVAMPRFAVETVGPWWRR